MTFAASAASGVVWFPAENDSAIMPAAVVTTETAFAIALIRHGVSGDFQRGGRNLVIAPADRMTGHAISVGITDVSFMCEFCVVSLARLSQHGRIV